MSKNNCGRLRIVILSAAKGRSLAWRAPRARRGTFRKGIRGSKRRWPSRRACQSLRVDGPFGAAINEVRGLDAATVLRLRPGRRPAASGFFQMTPRFILVGIFLVSVFLGARPALAVCTQSGTVASTSTVIVGPNDISGIEGRHYFLIMNTGATNGMNVAIGSNNNATNKDMYLSPGASWVMTMQNLKMVPGGDVAAISASGTNYAFCDW